MYLAVITGLSYNIYAVGKTKNECCDNLSTAFQGYVAQYGSSVEEWVARCGEDFAEYDNNILKFLYEYYGYHFHDITKGYAFGWES